MKAELQIGWVFVADFMERVQVLDPPSLLSLLLLSLGNAPSLQTEILSLYLSLSLKTHMIKFLKKTCNIQPKGLANQQDQVGGRLEGLVPVLGPVQGHSREMNPGGSSHCGEALFNAPISPCLAEMDSQKVIQDNLGVLRALQSRGGLCNLLATSWEPGAMGLG